MISQSIPTPEQFLRFVNDAKNLEDKEHGRKRVTGGTLKLMEQLNMERCMSHQCFEELCQRGYGDAIAVLRTMHVEIV